MTPPRQVSRWRWLDPKALPPIEVHGHVLSTGHVEELLDALAACGASFDELPPPLVSDLREGASEASRDAFAWALVEAWLAGGAPSKDKWALAAVGWLGGDASAKKLAPLVRGWPGEGQQRRAVLGLDVLKTIGSDVALVQLSNIARKAKFLALRRRANEAMDRIARRRKLTRDELEDRIVPSSFDDDAIKIQAARLEQAMVSSRAWSAGDFEALLLRHPLMRQLARMLLWSTWTKKTLLATFRVAEDGTLADPADEPFELPRENVVRIVHPLDLDRTPELQREKSRWEAVFVDYEIIAPFPQLDRPTYTLDPSEKKLDDLRDRFRDRRWSAAAFIGKLRRRGWVHGAPRERGIVDEHRKAFTGSNVTAVIRHAGYPIGALDPAATEQIEHVYFVAGDKIEGYDPGTRLKLASVDPKAVSEVLYDLL